jgi:urease accessory protein UreH
VNPGSGSLTIAARRSGARTVLGRVRYDGISRCSRAFAHGDAALVVLSQLGPGVVRGDDVTTSGHVYSNAHLIVTSQAATRLMGGARVSRSRATWTLDDGAVLELVGEPLVAAADARYEATTSIELGAGALALFSEIATVPRAAAVRMRTIVARGGREILYDAFDAAAASPSSVGTFAVIGLPDDRGAALMAALDGAADTIDDVHCGFGMLAGGVFARLLGSDVWPVRAALQRLRGAARAAIFAG